MTPTPVAPARGSRVLLAILALVHGLIFSDRMLIALLAPAIKSALHLSDLGLGLLLGTAFVATYTLATLALALKAENLDRRRMLAAGFVVSTLATASCGLAGSFLAFFAIRMAMGTGQAMVSPMAMSMIGEAVPESRSGRSVSIYTTGAALGRSAALLGGGALLAYVAIPLFGKAEAWRGVFLLAAVPNVAVLVLLRHLPARPRGRLAHEGSGPSMRIWLRRRWRFVLTHAVASSATVLVAQTLTAWATTMLVRRHGLSIAQAGVDFGVVVLVAAPLGHLAGGALLDRSARRVGARAAGILMACALSGTAAAFATLTAWRSVEAWCATLAVATFLLGVAAPAGFAGMQAITPQPLRSRATAVFIAFVAMIGFGLGPAALGGLTDRIFGANNIAAALLAMTTAAGIVAGLAALLQGKAEIDDVREPAVADRCF